ncbi:MAG: PAS domain-containing protein, partial [Planctomycetota bacterium]
MWKERKSKSESTPPSALNIDRRAEKILQTSIDGFCVVGLDGKIIHANPALSNISGYSQEELLKMKIEDLEVIESAEDVAEHIEKIQRQGYDRFETKHRRKDGSIIDVEISTQFCDFEEDKFFYSFFHDITDRKQAVEKLKESEHRYQLLFDSAPMAILLLDPETGRTLDCNNVALEFAGISKQQFLSSLTAADLSPPFQPDGSPSAQKAEELLAQAFNGESLKFEWTFVRPDGQQRVGSVHLVPIQYKDTKRILLASEDITELKNIENQLQLSEEKYKTLYESSRDAIMMLAPPDWNFTAANKATVDIFKAKDEKEFISKSPWQLSPEFQLDGQLSSVKAKEMIEKAMKEGSHFFEWQHKRLNDQEFPATVLLTRIKLGNEQLLQATVRDTTHRKQAEEQLQESEAKYRKLFEYANDATTIMDVTEERGFHFVDCSESTLKFFGCTNRDQIIGKTPDRFSPDIQPDGQPSREKAMKLAQLALQGFPQIFEWEHVRPDGTPYWANVSLSRIEIKGRFYILAVGRDITEHKLAE